MADVAAAVTAANKFANIMQKNFLIEGEKYGKFGKYGKYRQKC
jgi:hypothetical protein